MSTSVSHVPLGKKVTSWAAALVALLLLTCLLAVAAPQQAQADDLQIAGIQTQAAGDWTGTGTADDPYVISDAEGLQKLAAEVNASSGAHYSGDYFKLGADIDLGNVEWTPIGYSTANSAGNNSNSTRFAGTFDGDGHVIKGLKISEPKTGSLGSFYTYGLFGDAVGTFKNFIVQGDISIGAGYPNNQIMIGGVVAVAYNASTFENVGNEVSIHQSAIDGSDTSHYAYVGGILGRIAYAATMTGCYNKAEIVSSYGTIGGLAGFDNNNNSKFTACYNAGDITLNCGSDTALNSKNALAGFAGSTASSRPTFTGCFNSGALYQSYSDAASTAKYYGAMVGYTSSTQAFTGTGVYYLADNMYYKGDAENKLVADQAIMNGGTFNTATAIDAATLKDGATIEALNAAASDVNEGEAFQSGATYPLLYWEVSGAPIISAQPAGYEVEVGGTATALSVTATLPEEGSAGADGTLSYQWYSYAHGADPATAAAIEDATESSYTPVITEIGATDYYCVVTNSFTLEGEAMTATATSEVATVNVQDANDASTPVVEVTLAAEAGQADAVKAQVAVSGLTYTDGTVAYKLEQSAEGATFDAVEGTAEVADGAASFEVPVNTSALGANTVKVTVTNTYQLTKTASGNDAKTITISGKTIGSADELAAFAAQVNAGDDFSGRTVTLTADIDMSTLSEGVTFEPIGTSSNRFKGELAGDKHAITNLAIADANYAALVGYADGASIHDLEVSGTVSGSSYVAGIVAYATNTTVVRVANHAAVTQTGTSGAAGIAAQMSGTSSISASYNDADITGLGNVGGIVGNASRVAITDCYNLGTITNTGSLAYSNGVAGIAALTSSSEGYVTITNCYNAGKVVTPDGATARFGSIAYTQDTASRIQNPVCQNVFYLEGTSSVSVGRNNSSNYDGTEMYAEYVKPLTAVALPAAYVTLGENWQQAPTNYHDGYPALSWEAVPEAALVTFTLAEPVDNLHLSLDVDGKAVTPVAQADGTYTALLPAGTYTWTAEAFGYIAQSDSFTVAADPLTVTIPAFQESAKQAVTFVVTGAEGAAVENPTIVVKNVEGTVMEAVDGAYALPDGTYEYTVSAKGYMAKSGSITVAGAAVSEAVALEALPPAWDGENSYAPDQVEGVYQIASAYELAWIAEQVNAGALEAPVNAVLTADIDLNDKAWTPIGAASNPFVGTFDGQGFAVKGLTATAASANDYIGLFGNVGSTAAASTIKNLTVAGTLDANSNKAYVGGVAACIVNTTVECCGSAVELKNLYDGMPGAGGVVGAVASGGTSSISSCKSTSAIASARSNYGEYFGGIVGKNSQAGLTIDSCYFTGSFGDIYGYVGGILGQSSSAVTLSNCYSTAAFSVSKSNSGLVAGSASNMTFQNCYYFVPEGSAVSKATGSSTDPDGITKVEALADLTAEKLGSAYKDSLGSEPGAAVLVWEKVADKITLADGVEPEAQFAQFAGVDWTIDLEKIFVDAAGDPLTYTVAVNGAEPTPIDGANYGYTVPESGETTLVFTASDGKGSSATYTVTLTQREVVTAEVDYTSQMSGGFLHAPQLGAEVPSNEAELYGYTDSVEGVSALDVLVAAHEQVFGEDFTAETAGEFLAIGSYGSPSRQFGVEPVSDGYSTTFYGGFFLNHCFANDGTMYDASHYNGTTVTTQEVKDGDLVEFFFYESEYYGDTYTWFLDSNDAYSSEFDAVSGKSFDLNLKGFYASSADIFKDASEMVVSDRASDIDGAQIYTVDIATGALTPIEGAVSDEGEVTVSFAEPGEYWITAYNSDEEFFPQILTLTKIKVAQANRAPQLADGVEATAADKQFAGLDWSVDLGSIFADPDGDALSYTVAVNGADAVAADADYSISVPAEGETVLVFTASDAEYQSPTYTVTLTQREVTTAKVDFTSQMGGAFLHGPQFDAEVANNEAEKYGYIDEVEGVSTLDVLVAAHELVFGEEDFAASPTTYLVVKNGGISTNFGVETFNSGIAVNGEAPCDTSVIYPAAYGWPEMYGGYAVTQIQVSDGDVVEFFVYQDSMALDYYTWFAGDDGARLNDCSVEVGETLALNVKGYSYGMYGLAVDESLRTGEAIVDTGDVEDLPIGVVDENGAVEELDPPVAADDNGAFTVTFETPGTYYLVVQGDSLTDVITSILKVTVTPSKAALRDAIAAAEAANVPDASQEAKDALAKAIADAKAVLDDAAATADQIAAAQSAVDAALKTATDEQAAAEAAAAEKAKGELADSIAAAEAANVPDASQEAKDALAKAIADAKTVLADPAATAQQLADAKAAVDTALKAATDEQAAADEAAAAEKAKSELADSVAAAKAANVPDASQEAKDALAKAIADAEALLADPAATAQQLADAKTALDTALKAATDEQAAADAANKPVAVGDTFTVKTKQGTFTYKVTADGQVTLTKAAKTKKNGKVTVNKVKYQDVTYKVTAIGDKAFKSSKLKKVTTGANVTTIGKMAFQKNKQLKAFVVGKNVAKVGAKAFAGDKKLKKITVKSQKLTKAKAVKNALKGSKVKTVKLKGLKGKVKKNTVKAFKKAGKKGVKVK